MPNHQKIDWAGKSYLATPEIAQLFTRTAADAQSRELILEMGLKSGGIVSLNPLAQLRDALQWLVGMQAPALETILRKRGFILEANVVESAIKAIRAFPWDRAVTFAPMPDQKPHYGFLEMGQYDGNTYTWEDSVPLLLGSNGKVYAEVSDSLDRLPDLDEGQPLSTTGGIKPSGEVDHGVGNLSPLPGSVYRVSSAPQSASVETREGA